MAAFSKLATAVCLLVVLLLAAFSGSVVVEARPVPRSAPRRVVSSKPPDSYRVTSDGIEAFQKTRSFRNRKLLGETTTKSPENTPPQVADFNVDDFGAAGDGKTDDTKAFQNAWAKACSSAEPSTVLVPAGKKYLIKQTPLSGPCKSQVTFNIDGTLVAPEDKTGWNKQGYPQWISFTGIDWLTVTGKGTLDGTGKSSWKNSCRVNRKHPCTFAPAALTFSSCNHLKVEDIKLLNSPQIHLFVQYCRDVTLSHLTITAPGTAPEADGIHLSHTEDIQIIKPVIKAGDDCISVASGTKNLYASDVQCGPGHGISIGSLGNKNSEAQVSNITIDGAHLSGTIYGARIKTWQGGSGYAKDIKFLNMVMDNVKHPILIDQFYCTQPDPSKPKPCKELASAVEISDVQFKNIRGTGVTKYKDVINLHCSKTFPCRDVVLQDIDIKTTSGGKKNTAISSCENVKLSKSSDVSPAPCTSVGKKDDWIQDEFE
ncbi:hypothetical protein PR202_gb23746 [Eleusine coracana subsp. coracana]|uniref:endo-polygalacturonase n=1 Tax=Eleusine coracana subsp. coracana TaxID=191504 RepID=A0AAV5FJ04_ELECO|nr:hypothetical protein QOZ80_5BG0438420 [Eleusine coracana subsp. coracana]GJN35021.1 hypothetical protein PR202_gb23746 [Eleusine coracana subsp. coracana]